MNELSAFSDCLDLLAAKKILTALQKPGKQGAWADWSGEGGAEIEMKEDCFPASNLSKFGIPEFCSSFKILASDRVLPCARMPCELLIGGDLFTLPEYGDCVGVSVDVVLRELNYPITVGFGRYGGMRFHQKGFNVCSTFSLVFPKRDSLRERLTYGKFPEKALARKVIEGLKKDFGLPDERDPGLLDKLVPMDTEMGEFYFRFELSRFEELKIVFNALFAHLLADSPCHSYNLLSEVSFGSTAKFAGEVHNVGPVIGELLPLIQAKNDYPAYDITCYPLGPRSWKDREKSRKKLKQAIHEELGTATLENGTVAKVSLGIEKEGYVFYLNFENDDDFIKFYHSKLFQKTKWHSGAE